MACIAAEPKPTFSACCGRACRRLVKRLTTTKQGPACGCCEEAAAWAGRRMRASRCFGSIDVSYYTLHMALHRRHLLVGAAAVGVPAALIASSRVRHPAARPFDGARPVLRVVAGMDTKDGAGVRLRRALGGPRLSVLDPFLLLDEFRSDEPEDWMRGFPEHPHRGFETVSYVLDGAVEHRDSLGNHGRIGPGAVQWMTAGRGVVHAEMPKGREGRHLWGFQLWVNLPAREKMTAARYQEIEASAVPEFDVMDARVRLVAGTVGAHVGPVDGVVIAPMFLDVNVPAGGRFAIDVPSGHNVAAYVATGAPSFGPHRVSVERGDFAVFGEGARVCAEADVASRFLLLAGAPIREPVARRGPFVMNTEAELDQAVMDYRSGRLVGG